LEVMLLDSLRGMTMAMQLHGLHIFTCTQKTTRQIDGQLQFCFSARLKEFGPWTRRAWKQAGDPWRTDNTQGSRRVRKPQCNDSETVTSGRGRPWSNSQHLSYLP